MDIKKVINIHGEEWVLTLERNSSWTDGLRMTLYNELLKKYVLIRRFPKNDGYILFCSIENTSKTTSIETIKEVKIEILKFLTNTQNG